MIVFTQRKRKKITYLIIYLCLTQDNMVNLTEIIFAKLHIVILNEGKFT